MSAPISFADTAIAFESKSNEDLKRAYSLFQLMGMSWLVELGTPMVSLGLTLKLPITGIIKKTVFKQFCGGESIDDCAQTTENLWKYRIGTILDYSVEGEQKEGAFDATCEEILHTIERAANDEKIPFCVFKPTGVGRMNLLTKVNAKEILTREQHEEFNRIRERVDKICAAAYEKNVCVLIDAEESWIQSTIDFLVREMMLKYNKKKAIVYNTVQLYRHDRLEFIKRCLFDARTNNYLLGLKLVRGAYMEKERARAKEMVYPSPIQVNKEASDKDYNEALRFCLDNVNQIAICAGTHNEASTLLLVELMEQKGIAKNDQRIYFSQLLGMSDSLSFNLSHAGYNVVKYVPYGPVKSVMPYLFRRAQENTSVKGQTGRELSLIKAELKRRGLKK